MPVTTLTTEIGGRTLTIETGKLALLAGGSVTVRYGDTMLLGTANRSEPRPGLDFFPLTVDFEERMYAAGKIPGGFIKRESRPSGGGHPGRAPDRPADPPALPRGLQGRRPDRPDGPLDRPGERPRHHRHHRRVGRADHQRDPVPRADRVRAHRAHRRRVRGQPHVHPARELGARPGRLRHPRRDHDGRGRRQDPARGRDGRGHHVRPPLAGADHRPPGPAAGAGRQGQAHAVPRAGDRVGARLRRCREADKPFVVFDVETTSRDVKQGAIVEIGAVKVSGGKITDRWSTLVKPTRPIVGKQLHGITDDDVKGPAGDRKPPKPSSTGRATHSSSATTSASTSASSTPHSATDANRGRPLHRHADARARGVPRPDVLSWPTWRGSSGSSRAQPPRPAGRRGDRAAAHPAGERPAAPHRHVQGCRCGLHPAAGQNGGDRARRTPHSTRRSKVERRLQQEPVRPAAQEDRPRAGAQRGHPHGRPRSRHHPPHHGRGRPAAASPRLGAVHPRRDAGADGGDARPVVGRPAHRHHRPRGVQALPPPLQHAALLDRREQADARPGPA